MVRTDNSSSKTTRLPSRRGSRFPSIARRISSDVVDLDQALDRHLTGLVVDLDVGDAGRVGDRRVRLRLDRTVVVVHVRKRLEGGAGARDQLAVGPGSGGRDLRNRDLAVGRALG